jgi:hypothetical protein
MSIRLRYSRNLSFRFIVHDFPRAYICSFIHFSTIIASKLERALRHPRSAIRLAVALTCNAGPSHSPSCASRSRCACARVDGLRILVLGARVAVISARRSCICRVHRRCDSCASGRLQTNSTAEDEATSAQLNRSCSNRSANPPHAAADQNRSSTRSESITTHHTHAGDTTDRMQTDDSHADDTSRRACRLTADDRLRRLSHSRGLDRSIDRQLHR